MLPIMTSPEDLAAIVDYLKTKATGVKMKDATATLDNRLLDGRKITAYEAWGFVSREGDILKLTEKGRRFARASEDTRRDMLGDVIKANRAYRIAIEWMFHSELSTVAAVDLAAHWLAHAPGELETETEKTVRNQVTTFFQLAEGAGLGRYVVGRGSQPTRLEPDRSALGQFIGELGIEAGVEEQDETEEVSTAEQPVEDLASADTEDTTAAEEEVPQEDKKTQAEPEPRVFISHGRNTEIVDQIKTMLELAELKYEVAVEEETAAIPVPEKVLASMRRCSSAVICVTVDPEMEREDGTYSINENVLIEIGSAFVLYEKRVALVWDRRLTVPSNLQGLYRCEFEGDELTWSAGMKLMKVVNQFKRDGGN